MNEGLGDTKRLADLGIRIKNFIDLSMHLPNSPSGHSMKALVERYLYLWVVDKTHQDSDWKPHPLPSHLAK
jgi:ribonuclease D